MIKMAVFKPIKMGGKLKLGDTMDKNTDLLMKNCEMESVENKLTTDVMIHTAILDKLDEILKCLEKIKYKYSDKEIIE